MKLRTHILLLLLGVMGSLSAHTAHWITADHALRNTPNTWIEFRKTLTLAESPQEALAHIAADTKYWLWVGDSLIVFEGGLKRGPNPRDTYYDVVDLAPFLTAGDNEIRVLLSPKMVHTKLISNEHCTMFGSCNITNLAFTQLGELDIELEHQDTPLIAHIQESVSENID